MQDTVEVRRRMVEQQLKSRGIRDERVLAAMGRVPREKFVPPDQRAFAYDDGPLPIAEGQTISQPYIVARMVVAAEIREGERVLEIGTGSGYAAAIMSLLAAEVISVERHAPLADTARRVLAEAGYSNVSVRHGDGTAGLPDAGPFAAIVVAAGGPSVPRALREQLTIGGRLVIPVGEQSGVQRLLRVTRTGADEYDEEDLSGVRFVPLIGAYGWDEGGRPARPKALPERIAEAAEPFDDLQSEAFGDLFDRFGNYRVVLLGEASHGTSEFYRARAAITRRLIERHGFTIVAVEADWPDAAAIDRYVRHLPHRHDPLAQFDRFPTWMWRNTDVADFIDWLHDHNAGKAPDQRAGFSGLDMYNMGASMAGVLQYLDQVDPAAAAVARERYGCLSPWQLDPATYGRAVLTQGYRKCEEAVVAQCRELLDRHLESGAVDGEGLFDATQNARLVASAERYYRVMYQGGAESWNLRDSHMFETLEQLLKARGPEAKAVVWAHNSHIGDARETDMGRRGNEHNIGQLCRERFGDQAALIGFGTDRGTVAAATDWGDEMQFKRVRPARPDSHERAFHDSGLPRFMLDFRRNSELAAQLAEWRLERFIGVIYRPETELQSHYAKAALSRQFDAFVWIDETNAVTPLGPQHARSDAPETWPFGL